MASYAAYEAYASGSGFPPAQYYTVTRVNHPSSKNPNIITLTDAFPSDGTVDRWPAEHEEMRLMNRLEPKHVFWRGSAGEWFARGVGLWNDDLEDIYWSLKELPQGYGLFEQITHPKTEQHNAPAPNKKLRTDRFVWGHKGRKIRSAISLGRHIAHLANPVYPNCPCDGCKTTTTSVAPPRATSRSIRSDSPAFNPKPRPSRGAGKPGVKAQAKPKAKPRAKKNKSRSATPESMDDGRYFKSTPPTTDSEDSDRLEGGHWGYKFPPRKLRQELPLKELPKRVPQPGRELLIGEDELDQMKVVFAEDDEELDKQRKEDIELSALPRQGELVWVKVELGEGAASIGRWPGVVQARNVEWAGDEVTEVKFEVALLAAKDLIETDDVVPWLGYIPHELTHAMGEEGRTLEGEQTLEQLIAAGFKSIVAAFVLGVHVGKWYSTIQARSVPSTGKGKHFVFNPFHAKRATPWGCLTANDAKRLPVPAIRYLVHDWIACGPETYWPADALRLVPTAEITSNVLINRTPSTSTTLPTTLIIVPSQFYRGGDNCPLLVRGQIFEMVLLAPAEVVVEEIVEDPIIDSDDNIFERFPISALPPPFPGHKWQRLTAAPLKDHDVLASDVAGRYYPLGGELQDEDEVENIAAQAKKSGTTGEVGIKALGLLLAGLVSGGKVPKIEAPHGVLGGRAEQLAAAEKQAKSDIVALYRVRDGEATSEEDIVMQDD